MFRGASQKLSPGFELQRYTSRTPITIVYVRLSGKPLKYFELLGVWLHINTSIYVL